MRARKNFLSIDKVFSNTFKASSNNFFCASAFPKLLTKKGFLELIFIALLKHSIDLSNFFCSIQTSPRLLYASGILLLILIASVNANSALS